jgi:hypothetical protein
MFIPVSQSAAPVAYAAGIVAPNPPPVVENAGAIRLTQVALSGPGAAIIPNTVSTRQAPTNERATPRASQFLAQLLAQSEPSPTPAPVATANTATKSEQFTLALTAADTKQEPAAPIAAPLRRKGVAGKAASAYGAANDRNLALLGKAEIFAAL